MEAKPKRVTDTEKQTHAFHRFADYNLQTGKPKKTYKARGHGRDVPKT